MPTREIIPIVNRTQWLRSRERDVTASCAAWMFGEGHGAPHKLAEQFRDAAGRRASNLRVRDAHAVRAGRILEPGIAVAVAEARPDWHLEKSTTYHRMPEFRLGASPDYWLGDDGVIECKGCGPSVFDGWGGKPPLSYLIQVLTQMVCTDRSRGYVAVLIRKFPELPLHIFEVKRSAAAERILLRTTTRFWRAFDAGSALPVADSGGLRELLDGGTVVAPGRALPRVDISKLEAPF